MFCACGTKSRCAKGRLTGARCGNYFQRLRSDTLFNSEAVEPMDPGFATKPGDLALGVTARGLLNFRHNGFEARTAQNVFAKLRVAEESERFCGSGHAYFDQVSYFLEPA